MFAAEGPAEQVKGYWESSEVDRIRETCELVGYLVVIVGSRKILLWRLDKKGDLGKPVLRISVMLMRKKLHGTRNFYLKGGLLKTTFQNI